MQVKFIKILFLFTLTLLFSCSKNDDIPTLKSEGMVRLLIYGNVYNFEIKQDGVDNVAIVTTTSNGGKWTSLTATDAKTFDDEFDKQLRILIGFIGDSAGDYTFHVDDNDPNTPQATVTINLPGDHLNDMPDFISWEDGIVTVVEVDEAGGYIEGAIDGKFKDTQLGDGMPIQNMPEITIHGEFKIYRSQ